MNKDLYLLQNDEIINGLYSMFFFLSLPIKHGINNNSIPLDTILSEINVVV